MTGETKVLIGVLAATVLIILGGAWWAGQRQAEPVAVPAADQERLVRADDPVLGPAEAQVTVVEFGDFQCPACGTLHPVLKHVKEQYADQSVRFVYRQFPLSQVHEYAQLAAEASLAAQAQGKFWEYHDRLFENQDALEREDLIAHARELGLDVDALTRALDEGTYREAVQQDLTDANILRLRGTPTLFVNGVQYTGAYTTDALAAAIDAALNQ